MFVLTGRAPPDMPQALVCGSHQRSATAAADAPLSCRSLEAAWAWLTGDSCLCNAFEMAEYAFVAPVGVESFDWSKQGDEWVHRVSECMVEMGSFSVTGHKYDDTTKPFIEFTGAQRRVPLDTRLVIIPREAGVFIAVAGKTEELDEVAADAWVQAARCATSRLGTSGGEYHWTAIIAPPAIRITGAEPAIEGETNVGGFRLVSGGQPLYERMPPQLPSFTSAGSGVSWPILVEARHIGYNWEAALQKAAFDLHRLCALLSVVLGECLVVREAPARIADGVRKAPSRLWWQQWGEDFDASREPELRNVKTMPDWASAAWQQMNSRPQLGHAVAVHHEGLRAQFEHPSLALVAFIASIEAVANLLFREERCSECNAHKDVAARFRATLRLVATDEEATRLDAAYSPRSRTVHQGWLHGGETTPGMFNFSWGANPIRDFEWMVWGMRAASRRLLESAVRGELPASRVAFDPSIHLTRLKMTRHQGKLAGD